jgi:hypothetical protein
VLSASVTTNDLFFKVSYDPAVLSPAGVDFAGVLGKSIDLAVTSVAGEVAVGSSRIRNAGDSEVSVTGRIATLRFKPMPFVGRKVSGCAPSSPENRIIDLAATPVTGGMTTLTWTEKNLGDYDNSGEVGVPDITPIATNYLVSTGSIIDLVDGDDSGDIGISDITVIANNYLNAIAGYRINVQRGTEWGIVPNANDPSSPYTLVRTNDQPSDRCATFSCDYTLQAGDDENFMTQPVGPDASLGIQSNTTGGGNDVPFPPKILDLEAHGLETLNPGEVELTWTTPNDPNLDHYELWWQPDNPTWAPIELDPAVPGTATSYIATGCGTDGDYYNFGIRAVNYNLGIPQRAPFSNIATGRSWIGPEPSPAVTDLTAVGGETIGDGIIRLTWTPSNDSYMQYQQILMQQGGDGTNLTVEETDILVGTNTFDITVATEQTYWFMVRGVNELQSGQPQYGEDGNVASAQAWFDTPPIPPLTSVVATRNRTTFEAGDTINLSVDTNLDGTAYEDVQTFAWTVLSGDATITGGATSRDATAEVNGATTATFQITVDSTVEQKSDTVMVIGTTMAPATQVAGVSSPKYIFTGWNYFKGANDDINQYYADAHVVGITLWASW